MAERPCAVGFSDHTGWAVAVVLAVGEGGLRVIHRERFETVDPALPRQAFHAVAEQGAPPETITAVRESAAARAPEVFGVIERACGALGHTLAAAGVCASPTMPESLDRILASHTLLHAAEGALYREALAEAAAASGLGTIVRAPGKEALALAAAESGMATAAFTARLTALRDDLGPPWNADHKLAAAAAFLAARTYERKQR